QPPVGYTTPPGRATPSTSPTPPLDASPPSQPCRANVSPPLALDEIARDSTAAVRGHLPKAPKRVIVAPGRPEHRDGGRPQSSRPMPRTPRCQGRGRVGLAPCESVAACLAARRIPRAAEERANALA